MKKILLILAISLLSFSSQSTELIKGASITNKTALTLFSITTSHGEILLKI